MPGDGNPHPLPRQPDPPTLMWGLPPYPALGWNGVQPPQPTDDHHQENIQGDDNADGGWGAWVEPLAQLDEVMQQDIAEPAQEQNSMVLDHPNDSNSSSSSDEVQQICVVDENPVDEHVDVVSLNLAIVPYHTPPPGD